MNKLPRQRDWYAVDYLDGEWRFDDDNADGSFWELDAVSVIGYSSHLFH